MSYRQRLHLCPCPGPKRVATQDVQSFGQLLVLAWRYCSGMATHMLRYRSAPTGRSDRSCSSDSQAHVHPCSVAWSWQEILNGAHASEAVSSAQHRNTPCQGQKQHNQHICRNEATNTALNSDAGPVSATIYAFHGVSDCA